MNSDRTVSICHAWRSFRHGILIKAGLLLLVVLGGKWMWIAEFAGEVPFVDQWGSEGESVYAPMLRGDWSWANLTSASNEHRIVMTRLLGALIFTFTGHQWDPMVQLAASAVVHAVWLALVGAWLMRRTRLRFHPWICGLLALLGVLPFAYENTLWSFQSQFYFLLLFSTIAGWGLLSGRPISLRWWIGVMAGLFAVVSMGSGGVVGGAVLVVLGMRAIKQRRVDASGWPSASVAIVLIGMMGWLHVDVGAHAKYAADSWTTFSIAMWRLLAWPFPATLPMACIVWLPFVIFGACALRTSRRHLGRLGETTLFLGVLVLSQVAALAWMRGNLLTTASPSSRYLDVLVVGLIASLTGLVAFPFRLNGERMARLILPAWSFVVCVGLLDGSLNGAMESMGNWRKQMRVGTDLVANFLRTGDTAVLETVRRWDPLVRAVEAWQDERRSALPPALQSRPPAGFGFPVAGNWKEDGFDPRIGRPGGYAVWGSFSDSPLPNFAEPVVSEWFTLRRNAISFSYACSSERGVCGVEFVESNGNVAAAVLIEPIPGAIPFWQIHQMRLASGKYRLKVYDQRQNGWFAITPPREMSLPGFFVRSWIRCGTFIFIICGTGLTLLLAWPFYRPIRRPFLD